MAKKVQGNGKNGEKNRATSKSSRSYVIASGTLNTADQYANLISALVSETVKGETPPPILTATCNGIGKLLKMVEFAHKYGGGKLLQLSATK